MNFLKFDKLHQAWQVFLSLITLLRLSSLIKLDKLHRTWQALLNLINFIKLGKLYQAWRTSARLISFIKLDQLHQSWSIFIKLDKFCQNWWTSSTLIHFDQLYHVRTLPANLMFAWIGGGTACDVFSVVRHSRMWCPHDVGRDSWVWGEQEAL